MKKVLLLGSACADITIAVDHLPGTEEDINPNEQRISLGGCASNVSNMLRLMGVPYEFACVTGSGIYGAFVRKELKKRGIEPRFRPKEENGSCVCLVDAKGDRTFISVHGAEYKYKREWMRELNPEDYCAVYVCGIDLEEKENACILNWLESAGITVYFAPGPRIQFLSESLMNRMLALKPVLHMNLREAVTLLYSRRRPVGSNRQILEQLYDLSGNIVIVTAGRNGSMAYDGRNTYTSSAVEADQIDGTGAGDSHFGTVIASLQQGKDLQSALDNASIISSQVISNYGPVISDKVYGLIAEKLK